MATIRGDGGSNFLQGGFGVSDEIFGGGGNDTIISTPPNPNSFNGQVQGDFIFGGDGNDTIIKNNDAADQAGNQTYNGRINDYGTLAEGDNGDDTFFISGDGQFRGEAGNDTFILGHQQIVNTDIRGFIYGGSGFDTLNLSNLVNAGYSVDIEFRGIDQQSGTIRIYDPTQADLNTEVGDFDFFDIDNIITGGPTIVPFGQSGPGTIGAGPNNPVRTEVSFTQTGINFVGNGSRNVIDGTGGNDRFTSAPNGQTTTFGNNIPLTDGDFFRGLGGDDLFIKNNVFEDTFGVVQQDIFGTGLEAELTTVDSGVEFYGGDGNDIFFINGDGFFQGDDGNDTFILGSETINFKGLNGTILGDFGTPGFDIIDVSGLQNQGFVVHVDYGGVSQFGQNGKITISETGQAGADTTMGLYFFQFIDEIRGNGVTFVPPGTTPTPPPPPPPPPAADGTITGKVFSDTNGDNTELADSGFEPGIAGVTVVLENAAGAEVARTTTDAGGIYTFNVPAGDYRVDFPTSVNGQGLVAPNVGPDGEDSDADPGTGETFTFSLGSGQTLVNIDAGYTVAAPPPPPPPPTPGVDAVDDFYTVTESEAAGDSEGVVLINDVTFGSLVTQVNGSAANIDQVLDLAGGGQARIFVDGRIDFDANGDFEDLNDGEFRDVSLTYGISNGGVSDTATVTIRVTGETDPLDGRIVGNVFSDTNRDNTEFADTGFEPGLNGVTVIARDLAGNEVARTTTFGNGNYELNLPAGQYRVEFPTDVNGQGLVAPNVGADSEDSDADPATGLTGVVTVPAGGTLGQVDAGYTVPFDPLDAVDDFITVTESEGAGDNDGNVLANDDTNGSGVVTVNGVTGNVGQFIDLTEGRVLVNADGSIDFDADGDFEDLNDGEFRDVTLTYSIDDGTLADTATVTIRVTGETDIDPLDAVDDTIRVFESEGAGDNDGNVLANDDNNGAPVVSVNGVTGNVGQFIDLAEGRVLVNADGSIDFDADGDFEDLNEGESRSVTVDYSIDDGTLADTATVTIIVDGETDINAVDDAITVTESEGAGDTDLNVLDNDANAGLPVVTVNGVEANVGEFVDLAAGGRVAINADGTLDFDADGDFDALNDGDSRSVTVDYAIGTAGIPGTPGTPGTPGVPGGTALTVEAEDLTLSNWFDIPFNPNASGSHLITFSTSATAELSGFSGVAGSYDVSVFIQDLEASVSTYDVLVNGAVAGTITTDLDRDGASFFDGTFSEFVVEDVALNTGDVVTLALTGRSGGEFGLVDRIAFTPDGGTGGTPGTPAVPAVEADTATVTITVLGEDDGATLSGRVTTEAPGTQSLTYIIDHSFDMYRRTASTLVEDANGDGQLRVVDVVLNRIAEETAGLDAAQTVNFILVGDETVRGAQTLTAGDIQAAAQANDLAGVFGAVFAQPDGSEVNTQVDFRAVNINLALQEARTYITDTTLGFDAGKGADQDNIVFITASDGTVGIDPLTGASLALDDFTAIRDELLDAAGIDADIDVVSVNTGIRLDEIDAGFDFSPVVIDPSNTFDPLLLVELDSDGVVNNVDGTDAFGLAELTENTTLVDTGEVLSVFAGGQEFTVASGALVDTNPAAEVFEFELAGIENLDPAQIFLGVDRDGDGVQDLTAAQVPAASIIETAPDTFQFDITLEPAEDVFGA